MTDSTKLARHDSGHFQQPTPVDLRALMRQQGWSCGHVSTLVGVNTRTVRRWIGGDYDIPYAAWRLLLIEAGLITHHLKRQEQQS